MKPSRTAALLAAAFLTLGLIACGGSSTKRTPSTPTQKSTAASPSASSALTPPGTSLAVGEEATVAWVPFSEENATKAQTGLELKASVLAIEKKSIGDLGDLELEADEEEDTPYFVTVRLEALGSSEPPADEQPALEFDAIDDRGQEQESTPILGSFPDCEEEELPQPFTNGKSYESCFVYLIRRGGLIDEIEWKSGPSEANATTPYFDEPVVWEGS